MRLSFKRFFSAHHELDMTEGRIPSLLIRYALPVLCGNIFMYLYNMVDAWVLGRSGQTEAYAAVGSLSGVIQTIVAVFWGFAAGAEILTARVFGSHDRERVSRAAHTAMTLTLILGAVLTAVGLLAAPLALRFLLGEDGDPEIYRHARTYLLIFFAGLTPMLVYNMGAGLLRSIGDTRRPFVFLATASVINIVLDAAFVFLFDFGVAGVAWATVIAQLVAAVMTVTVLFRTEAPVRLSLRRLRLDRALFLGMLALAVPAALTRSVGSVSAALMQSYIAGADGEQALVMGSYTTYNKLAVFFTQPTAALGGATATFVSQNLGAGRIKRARRGVYMALGLSVSVTLPLVLLRLVLAEELPYIFIDNAAIAVTAAGLFLYLSPTPLLVSFSSPFSSGLNGAGKNFITMLLSFLQVALVQLYLYLVVRYVANDILTITFGEMLVSGLTALLAFLSFLLFMPRDRGVGR